MLSGANAQPLTENSIALHVDRCCRLSPLALAFCHSELRSLRPKPARYPKQINTSGDRIRRPSSDLNLVKTDVAEQIAFTQPPFTIGKATHPSLRSAFYRPSSRFLGYAPEPSADSFPDRLVTERRVLGLSQRRTAERLGVDPGTLQGWEAGRHKPTGKSWVRIGRVLQSHGC